MRTIYKESILEKISEEIFTANMNGKRIAYFEISEEEKKDLEFELKSLSLTQEVTYNKPLNCYAIICGIPVCVK